MNLRLQITGTVAPVPGLISLTCVGEVQVKVKGKKGKGGQT